MKYESLDLRDLPRGPIAIQGSNEAGKTTIGECIAFALFGRTVRTEDTDPAQAIHWNSDRCTTTIEVELGSRDEGGGQGTHKIERTVDRAGATEARLYG